MVDNNTEKATPILASADIQAWNQTRNCCLELYAHSLIIKKKKVFWQKPLIISRIGTDQIDSFGLGAEPATTITLLLDDGVSPRHQEIFNLTDKTQTLQIYAALKTLLGPLDEISRSTKKIQDQEKTRREEEQKKENENRDYAVYFWTVAGRLIYITESLYAIVAALITESWEIVQKNYQIIWQQTEQLQQETGYDLLLNLQALGESCRDKNGMQVVNQIIRLLVGIATCTQSVPPNSRWKDTDNIPKIIPNWEHLQFLFLFIALQNEIVLDSELGDWVLAEKSMAKLGTLHPIMVQVLGLNTLDQSVQLLNSITLKDKVLVRSAATRLNTYLFECTGQYPYQKVK